MPSSQSIQCFPVLCNEQNTKISSHYKKRFFIDPSDKILTCRITLSCMCRSSNNNLEKHPKPEYFWLQNPTFIYYYVILLTYWQGLIPLLTLSLLLNLLFLVILIYKKIYLQDKIYLKIYKNKPNLTIKNMY